MLRKLTAESFEPIAGVLVILAAAGGLSGCCATRARRRRRWACAGAHMPALVLAWLLARWCGSQWVRRRWDGGFVGDSGSDPGHAGCSRSCWCWRPGAGR